MLFAEEAGNLVASGSYSETNLPRQLINSSNQSVTWAVTGVEREWPRWTRRDCIRLRAVVDEPGGGVNVWKVTATAVAAGRHTRSGSATVKVETPTGLGTSRITGDGSGSGVGHRMGDVVDFDRAVGKAIYRRDAEHR